MIATGTVSKIKRALRVGRANVNAVDPHYFTPLHYACLTPGDEVVTFLLDNFANIDEQNAVTGETP